tara:strand:- start:145 stop:1653 length:1509 start_codon:yes stop_codon:yes gene_type:complete
MAIKSNAYNFSNDLQRIGSSLANAFIGNARDDAAIALANYRDAQTVGQEQDNAAAKQLFDAGAALAQNPQFQSVIARAMNLDTISPTFMGPPSGSQIRTGTPAASNLARTFLGEYGNAEQMAGAASAYGDAGASRIFESMIRDGDADAIRRGFIGLGNNPTKYFDQGTAQTEIANDRAVGMDSNRRVQQAAENEDRLRFGPGSLGDRDNIREQETAVTLGEGETAARERWENYKADKGLEASKYDTDTKAGVARDKDEMADKLARWKHDNREIEMSVEPGKVLVLDPDTGKKLGLKPVESGEYKGLYILDGGKKPGDVTVAVGKSDVYIDKATADALGIPQNADGQYVIKGAGFESDASTRDSGDGGSDLDTLDLQRYNKEWRDSLVDYESFDDVPNHAEAGVKKLVTGMIRQDMKSIDDGGRGLNYAEAYAQNADVILGAGAYEVTTGSNFFVPKYFFDFFAVGNGKSAAEAQIKGFFRSDLGYSPNQASRVAAEILAARG